MYPVRHRAGHGDGQASAQFSGAHRGGGAGDVRPHRPALRLHSGGGPHGGVFRDGQHRSPFPAEKGGYGREPENRGINIKIRPAPIGAGRIFSTV